MTEADHRAHTAIRALMATCTQAGDARKADAYAACFARDGVLELAARIEGRDAIRAWMEAPSVIPAPTATPAAPAYVSHHLTTCRIDLTGPATATARTYWLVITAIGLDHSGYYDDRLVLEGDAWRIAHRRPRTLWKAEGSLVSG